MSQPVDNKTHPILSWDSLPEKQIPKDPRKPTPPEKDERSLYGALKGSDPDIELTLPLDKFKDRV